MKRKKRIFIFCLVVLGISIAAAAYVYVQVLIPAQTMQDASWWENASQDEIRQLCHRAISTRFGAHHNAFLSLAQMGNAESVPLLIRALKWHETPDEDVLVICTTGHCLKALRSLTGHNAGTKYLDWKRWWTETGSKLPAEAFYPRKKQQFQRKEAAKVGMEAKSK
ncbi:MAG: hypothetical protein D3910_06225 [Candidatus Electrothrix sp. ATG2]|nr:hypothetical protein [Candidatus Electrothrix sp. ATG2]